MAKFTSRYKGLLLQDDDGVWAKFEGGEFSTADESVIARLRAAEDVEEVDASDEDEDDDSNGDATDEPDDLNKRKVPELKAYAEEFGVDLGDATKKADIVAAIRAHFADKD